MWAQAFLVLYNLDNKFLENIEIYKHHGLHTLLKCKEVKHDVFSCKFWRV